MLFKVSVKECPYIYFKKPSHSKENTERHPSSGANHTVQDFIVRTSDRLEVTVSVGWALDTDN